MTTFFRCLVTVLVKYFHWRSYLVKGLVNWSKCVVAAAKHFCGVFLRKNDSLRQLETKDF